RAALEALGRRRGYGRRAVGDGIGEAHGAGRRLAGPHRRRAAGAGGGEARRRDVRVDDLALALRSGARLDVGLAVAGAARCHLALVVAPGRAGGDVDEAVRLRAAVGADAVRALDRHRRREHHVDLGVAALALDQVGAAVAVVVVEVAA